MSDRRVSSRGYTEPLLRVAAEGVSRLDEDGCESSGDIEGSRERVEVIDVLVHQPVTQPPGAQPFLGGVSRMIPRRTARLTFSTAVPKLSRYAQKKGQEPVAQGILQAGELGSEGLGAIDAFRRGELFREPFAVDGFGAAEEPLRDCREVTSLRSTKSRTRASLAARPFTEGRRIAWPSRGSVSGLLGHGEGRARVGVERRYSFETLNPILSFPLSRGKGWKRAHNYHTLSRNRAQC